MQSEACRVASNDEENKLIAERRQKLTTLRENGVAFPNTFRRTALAAELHAAYDSHDAQALKDEAVAVAVGGRMLAKRVMGKNSFVQIQDRSSQLQLFVQRDVLGQDAYAAFKKWDLGDILGARGTLMKTKTGELSVSVTSLELLVKSLRPLPDKWHGIADQELRLRQRYLDLIMSPDTRETFRQRSEVIRFMRSYLDTLRFLEVETPMMQPIAGGAAARPFETYHHALDQALFLRIAPELYLKRLLVGGFERVYEIGRVFRNEGLSTRHNPEFTMLELYQAFATYEDLMSLTENLIREVARSLLGKTEIEFSGERFELGKPFSRITVEQSLIDAHDALNKGNIRDVGLLLELCTEHGVATEDSWGAGKLQLELFEKTVEGELRGPVFVTKYPAEVSPLARAADDDPFLTDRFELFIAGREIANGFSELNDPEDQAERFRAQVAAKDAGDNEAMHFDADYIRALEYGMPPAAGLGIGVDRLVMLLTNNPSIRDVLLFPQLKPES
jgi:lysyl-tRNA synthetase class 2